MKQLYETALTGTKMGQLSKLAPGSIVPGTMLSIHCRPDNAYDPQAMSVHFGPGITSPQVGWVPAKQLEDRIVKGVLFNLARHGFALQARVISYSADSKELFACIGIEEEEETEGLEE